MTVTYSLELQIRGALAAVRVNGIEVVGRWDDRPLVAALDMGHALVAGENHVELLVGPTIEEPEGELSLYAIPDRHEKHDYERFVHWVLTPNELAPGTSGALERVVDHTFWLADAPPAWSWTRARPLGGPEERAVVLAAVEELHAALRRRDLRALHRAFGLAIAEHAVARHVAPDVVEGEWLAAVSDALVDETLDVAPFAVDDVDVTTAYGGRLVHVRRGDGGHPLAGRRGRGGAQAFVLPVALAHLEGRWQVVR